eukprot:3386094-Pyramimonas_sp.AAC.1
MTAASDRPQKKLRLVDLGRYSHITSSALCSLLKQLRDHPIPEHFSTTTQRRHRQQVAFQNTSHGPLLQTKYYDGANKKGVPMQLDITFQHPFGWIDAACKESPSYAGLVKSPLDRSSNFMSIMLYSDEVVPGNALKDRNTCAMQA